MISRSRPPLAAFGLAAWLAAAPALAQYVSTHPNNLPLSRPAEDVPIAAVSARVIRASGDPARDADLVRRVEEQAAALRGTGFSDLEVGGLLLRLEADPAIARVAYRLLPDGANSVAILFDIVAAPATAPAPPKAPSPAGFPDLLRNERSQVSAIVAGGIGVYSDGNPWFGQPALFNASSPIAGKLPGARHLDRRQRRAGRRLRHPDRRKQSLSLRRAHRHVHLEPGAGCVSRRRPRLRRYREGLCRPPLCQPCHRPAGQALHRSADLRAEPGFPRQHGEGIGERRPTRRFLPRAQAHQ